MKRPGTLLLVGPNEASRETLAQRLGERGYTVSAVADGVAALGHVEVAATDLVLLDMDLPGLGGLEVLSRLRAMRSETELPVIMVTDGAGVIEAFERGANDFVTRPIDLPVALARIGTHLSRKWALEDLRDSQERHAATVRGASDGLWDGLTGLPGRLLLLDLERAIKRSRRRPGYVFALLVLGLDRFKVVNDSLGPSGADRLLVEVARRLQAGLRSTDTVTRDEPGCTLARLGSDEFNVLLDDLADARDAVPVAERLRRSLEEPFEIDGHRVFLSARTGIAVSTTGYEQPDEILRDAITALNRAKTGPSPYEIFDPAMRARAISRLHVETDLRQAIERRSFEVHYQPIVSLATGRITAFEALLRWRHPVRGLINPSEFIPVAEDTGMILDIGRLALAESCRQMAAWQTRFGPAAPSVMCANVSSRQLANGHLVEEIAAILAHTGLAPSSLKLEITETAFISDVPRAHAIMNRARAMGVEWSLDDFGTGYSSLSYLHQLRVNTIKIDRSFVGLLGADNTVSKMVRAIVALAHNLGIDVVAEGVETAEQHAALLHLGCEFAQGFYFSKPVDASAADGLIAAQPWLGQRLSRV